MTARGVVVVFDGPPSHESGRFVEVETLDDAVGEAVALTEGESETEPLKLMLMLAVSDAEREVDELRLALTLADRDTLALDVTLADRLRLSVGDVVVLADGDGSRS